MFVVFFFLCFFLFVCRKCWYFFLARRELFVYLQRCVFVCEFGFVFIMFFVSLRITSELCVFLFMVLRLFICLSCVFLNLFSQ